VLLHVRCAAIAAHINAADGRGHGGQRHTPIVEGDGRRDVGGLRGNVTLARLRERVGE
jgi:hypothetical protein